MIGPGFGAAVVGEMLRGLVPVMLALAGSLVGIGVLIGWAVFS